LGQGQQLPGQLAEQSLEELLPIQSTIRAIGFGMRLVGQGHKFAGTLLLEVRKMIKIKMSPLKLLFSVFLTVFVFSLLQQTEVFHVTSGGIDSALLLVFALLFAFFAGRWTLKRGDLISYDPNPD
jgi:uncharacterized membrane protein